MTLGGFISDLPYPTAVRDISVSISIYSQYETSWRGGEDFWYWNTSRSKSSLRAKKWSKGWWHTRKVVIYKSVWPTCALVLQALPVVPLLADAVVLSGVCATLAACHQVAAIPACFAQRRAAWQVLLDVAACGEVCGWDKKKTYTQGGVGCSIWSNYSTLVNRQFTLSVRLIGDSHSTVLRARQGWQRKSKHIIFLTEKSVTKVYVLKNNLLNFCFWLYWI